MRPTLINKEISWLYFNERVLQEAENPEVPLLERVKFMGIYSNNLDEFFRVRVATLKRLTLLGKKALNIIGEDPKIILKSINNIVLEQTNRFDKSFEQIIKDLRKHNIYIVNEKQLDQEQGEFVSNYFHKEVRPKLIPIMLGQSSEFPDMKDDAIYLAVSLSNKSTGKTNYSLIQIPSDVLPRFLLLPQKGLRKFIILLDDIIRYRLKDIFYVFKYDEITANVVKLTKDAELDISDDVTESYIRKLTTSLKQRKEGSPVRFIYDQHIPKDLLNLFIRKLSLSDLDAIIPGGRYHNFKDFMSLPNIGNSDLKYPPLPPLQHELSANIKKGILKQIRDKDMLMHFPYHSFITFIDLLREAAIDPKVAEIKITLYRLAKNSSVINALINAAKNGKTVTAVVELQARFDEEANIYWSNKLTEEGVKVIYGVQGLKVHAKLCLITRKENKKNIYYACVGTGNFNEDTTSIFSDLLLYTYDRRITSEVARVFDFFDKNFKISPFRSLLVSPFYLRKRFIRLINTEIQNAKKGKNAYIYLKLNNLVDDEIIIRLYEAAKAGVKITLNVRGMFSALPDSPELKNNIESFAIIDRFLEHARIFVFCNDGDEKYYISSADLMRRNLDNRIEVLCPVFDKELQKEIHTFLEIQQKDNQSTRILDNTFSNKYRQNGHKELRAQRAFYEYLEKKMEKTAP